MCDFNLYDERVLSSHLSGLILTVSFLFFEILVRGMSHRSILMCVSLENRTIDILNVDM